MSVDLRTDLIVAAKHFYAQGWMVGTAGNLSARLDDGSFWITASGRQKGNLTETDFIRINLDGTIVEQPHPDSRPSAETSIHLAVYNSFPEAQACYHVHSVEANLVSRLAAGDAVSLPAIEMLKGLGVWEENPQVSIPLFTNYLEVPKIAQEICEVFAISPPKVPALLIRDHGVTVWANSPAAAYNYIEIVEYIFRYMMTASQSILDDKF
ncbi:MAG: methylthioribulose 1-phosphate dehydratase [Tychonema bourrellyi B0820]|uniref:Methylthioribulose-1-phosphate dehydratase n=1 Tax=Tychonema bourrellyi FEM_GT703 TaxID=2040638 RepID=A0A2G4F5N0_9CYAN|nr:methylthioribulose 1-phosphate dehydratase [Tychonema bourrellyi]MDQ2097826.1 methylthioribulose 1-phosphate dehydratase [Tychonema bourrellyi B0820]PHX57070.1 methylthioribulose 1-phosphate dehydratase [Tychonema bourrellyi FEM_GT703]